MSQHQAALLPAKFGKVEVRSRPTPTPEGKQVLVRITSAAVNPVDWKIIDYGIFINDFPAVLGADGAGIIEALGSEVTGFSKGDRVLFQGQYIPDFGTYQQYALVDSDAMAKTPGNITDDQASTIPSGATAALMALFQKSGISFPGGGPTATGKPILILGGSSSVGQYAIQLARIAGFAPILTTASNAHTSLLKSLGATHIFDRNTEAKTIQAASSSPITFAVDTISIPSTQALALEVLPPDSHLSLVLPLDESLKPKATESKLIIHDVYGSSHAFKDMSIPMWQALNAWITQGKIVPNDVQVVPGGLAGVPQALEMSKKGVSGVKLVVHPQE
ncbi:Zinc-binding dehydrogenase [Ceratobasidium sp. AG-Ba]|nr:Zinc-binding dehydrogenase [Ceratobasidium sp. AG-Ba]